MPKCFIVDVEVGSKYASVSIMLLKYWFLDGDVIFSKQITGIMVSMIDSKFGKKAMVKRKLLRYSTKTSLLDKFDLSSIDGSAYLDVPYAMKFFCQKGNGGKPLLHNFVSIFFFFAFAFAFATCYIFTYQNLSAKNAHIFLLLLPPQMVAS